MTAISKLHLLVWWLERPDLVNSLRRIFIVAGHKWHSIFHMNKPQNDGFQIKIRTTHTILVRWRHKDFPTKNSPNIEWMRFKMQNNFHFSIITNCGFWLGALYQWWHTILRAAYQIQSRNRNFSFTHNEMHFNLFVSIRSMNFPIKKEANPIVQYGQIRSEFWKTFSTWKRICDNWIFGHVYFRLVLRMLSMKLQWRLNIGNGNEIEND